MEYKLHDKVQATVLTRLNYGYLLSLPCGMRAIMKFHQCSTDRSETITRGTVLECDVIKITDSKLFLDNTGYDDKMKIKRDAFDQLQVGEVLEGTVRSITDFGVFMDLHDGLVGMVHLSELTRKRNASTKNYTIGDKHKVLVIGTVSVDRISLSMKDLEANPFDSDAVRDSTGKKFTGIVQKSVDYGSFVTIEELGVDALMHVNTYPKDYTPAKGDIITVRVLEVQPTANRISVSPILNK